MQLDGKADVWRWMTSDRRFAVDRFTVRTATRAGCILGVTGMGDLFPVHPAYRAILPVLWRHPYLFARNANGREQVGLPWPEQGFCRIRMSASAGWVTSPTVSGRLTK